MIKKYWSHEPLGKDSIFETYNSDNWLEVMFGWLLAKFLACLFIGVIVGIILIITNW